MKNANERYESAAQTGHVAYNVMYDSPFGLVHRKVVKGGLEKTLERRHHGAVLMEEAYPSEEGMCVVYAILSNQLRAVAKGPATTPRKPKNRPKKGTKPWTKIPYRFEDVEVGDIVRYKICDIKYSHKVLAKNGYCWVSDNCTAYSEWCNSTAQEAHILKPYKEPVKPQEEEWYRIGDRFELTYTRTGEVSQGMICRTDLDLVQLICIEGEGIGHRWNNGVRNPRLRSSITKEDFQKLFDYNSYTYKKI